MKNFRLFTLISFLLLLSGSHHSLAASSKVLLITSFADTKHIPLRYQIFGGLDKTLESAFRKKFEHTDFDAEVRTDADSYELYRDLTEGKYLGIFWVSHGTSSNGASTGLNSAEMLADKNLVDVRPLFNLTHPETQWLALVACDSDQALNNFQGHEGLVTFGYKKKIDALRGLKKAIRVFKRSFQKPVEPKIACVYQSGTPVHLTRTLSDPSQVYPAVWVENKGKVLGMLPSAQGGVIQSLDIHVEGTPSVRTDLKLRVTTGTMQVDGVKPVDLGKVALSGTPGASWRLFGKPDGTPIGFDEAIYQFTGVLPSSSDEESFPAFLCGENQGSERH